MTPGQAAYEEDLRRKPEYYRGCKRPSWGRLSPLVQETWERNPTPREWPADGGILGAPYPPLHREEET